MTRTGPLRVLYLQYANPAAYPPVIHSMAMLAEAGCDIDVVGLDGERETLGSPFAAGARVRLLPAERPGWRQKASYARFAREAAQTAVRRTVDWIYVSDPLAAPAARVARAARTAHVLYHEHDAPVPAGAGQGDSAFTRIVQQQRRALIGRADLCVAPNEARAEILRRANAPRDLAVVWNCPRRADAETANRRGANTAVRFLYQGSVVPARLPLSVVDAFQSLDARAELVIAGYETVGHQGYVQALLDRAASAGIANRVRYAGVLNRRSLLQLVSSCDVGLSLFPLDTTDPNESTMVGASNKAFEYLARGLPLIVADRPEWRRTFVDGGLARSCDPASAASVAGACRWFVDHPAERMAMGERGRQRVLDEWNYEAMFAPVMARLLAVSAPPREAVAERAAARI